MADDVIDICKWIESANCFEVMGQLRRLEVLSREDLKKAIHLRRPEWIVFMKEKAGIIPETPNETGDCA